MNTAAPGERRGLVDRMTTSAVNYWSAFVLDGGLSAVLVVAGLLGARGAPLAAAALFAGGLATCSFYHYAFHAWWFHARRPSSAVALHRLHHARPASIVGTPFFVSLGTCALTWAACAWVIGPALAAVFAGATLLGHCLEGAVHHALHQRRFAGDGWLARLQRRHDAHHRRHAGNFGVSSALWDRVFGTELRQPPCGPARRRRAARFVTERVGPG